MQRAAEKCGSGVERYGRYRGVWMCGRVLRDMKGHKGGIKEARGTWRGTKGRGLVAFATIDLGGFCSHVISGISGISGTRSLLDV